MNETLGAALELRRWDGERGAYHLVIFTGKDAETLSTHAALYRLEFGRGRGFGSIKLTASIGETQWRTSVFPQNNKSRWLLLISKKVMRAESIDAGDVIDVSLAL